MKINWGSGIAIFYSLFVIAMITMVIKSSQNKAQMVQENYYEKDLNYENFRLKRQNGNAVKTSMEINYNSSNQTIDIQFPNSDPIEGMATLFRPSNENMDQKFDLKIDSDGAISLPLKDRTLEGKWKLQIDWNNGTKEFYIEEIIII